MSIAPPSPPEIEYPETDGEPIAENTLQFQWIVTIQGNVDRLFAHDPMVFVAGDLFWYPVEGDPKIRVAPDTLVVFGRPKGHRPSYMQWKESGIAPQVVWEVLSPGNRPAEIEFKYDFYEHYGVEEYYVYNPDDPATEGWIRRDGRFRPILPIHGWISPRLGVRFDTSGEELVLYGPDGQRFLTFLEISERVEQAKQQAEQARQQAEQARQQAEQARQQAEQARQQAEQAKQQAEQAKQQAVQERQAKETVQAQAEEERRSKERLAARLRELGIDPDL